MPAGEAGRNPWLASVCRPGAKLDPVGEIPQEAGAGDAVDEPVVDGKRCVDAAADGNASGARNHLLVFTTNGDDA